MNNIKYLKNSIVYAMSLGSHELFHSNLWAWLMKKDHKYIKVFFEGFEHTENICVFREKKNMDISIECGKGKNKKIYIIENKFKDFPTVDQLKKYNEKQNSNCVEGEVLVDIKDSKEIAQDAGWKFLSYKEVSERLERAISDESDKVVKDVINEYIEILKCVQGIIDDEFCSEKNELRINSNSFSEYKEINLDNVLKKMSAKHFVEYLKRELKVYQQNKERIQISTGFSKNSAIIDIYIVVEGEANDWKEKIGISIQDKQYRYCVATKSSKIDEIFKKYADKQCFDVNDNNYSAKNDKRKTMAPNYYKSFAAFLGEKEKYIYQYHNNVLEESGLSFEKIKDTIEDDLTNLIEKI